MGTEKKLDLDLSNYKEKYPCVHCGYCCRLGPCGYGEYDEEEGQCIHLIVEDPKLETFICERYDEIVKREANAAHPMMDCGCSSALFNTIRDAVIRKKKLNLRKSLENRDL